MRALIAAPLLGLTLLGGCAQPKYLLSERTDEAPTATTSSLRDVPARYTDHAVSTAVTKVIPIQLTDPLTAEERVRIVAAADEWNHVMNGAVRFDVLPGLDGARPPGAVSIALVKTPWKISEQRNPQPIATYMGPPTDGGLIVIYANRLEDPKVEQFGDHSLRGLVVQELGFALGVPATSSLYTADIQDCVGRDAAIVVGNARNIPVSQLNWCETGATKIANATK